MKISQKLSDKIQKTIDEFTADFEPFLVIGNETSEKLDLRKIAAEINVLPIAFDWSDSWGIQPNGEIIFFSFDKPYKIDITTNQKIINMVFFRAAKMYSELEELLPVRNPESIVCPGCGGTGIIKGFADNEFLAKSVACNCGGVGWLPSADEKHLYFC
jgi:hypothetical protein